MWSDDIKYIEETLSLIRVNAKTGYLVETFEKKRVIQEMGLPQVAHLNKC